MRIQHTLLALALVSVSGLVGCKSDYEKFADDTCACKDAECLKGLKDKYKDLGGGGSLKDMDEKMKSLPEKDKTALAKGIECSMKIGMAGAK